MVYMITYDLNDDGKDYEHVIDAIKSASTGVWCSFWKSSWLIKSDLETANEVFTKIKPFIDNNDRLIVIEVKDNKQGCHTQKEWSCIDEMFSDEFWS